MEKYELVVEIKVNNRLNSALPSNKDLPPIITCGFYVSNYVWDDFDPNKNYIGAAIMAVKQGDTWYHDGSKEPFPIEARNGWYGNARIRPGYILLRDAAYLEDRYRNRNDQVILDRECNGDPRGCPTFHAGGLNSVTFVRSGHRNLFQHSYKIFFGENHLTI